MLLGQDLLILLGTQLTHAACLPATKSLEGISEVDLETFKPTAPKNEFVELSLFNVFCLGMLGPYEELKSRNFILDSSLLWFAILIRNITSEEHALRFENLKIARLQEYMLELRRLLDQQPPAKFGPCIRSLTDYFEALVLKRHLPGLADTVWEFVSASKIVSTRELPEIKGVLAQDAGRNTDPRSISNWLTTIKLMRAARPSAFNHISETAGLLRAYLSDSRSAMEH